MKPFRFISLYASLLNCGNLNYNKDYIAIEIIHETSERHKHTYFTEAINTFTSKCKSYSAILKDIKKKQKQI